MRRHEWRDNGAMLLPALIVAGVIAAPIEHVPPHAAHVCTPMRPAGAQPRWFVSKAAVGCARSNTPPGRDLPKTTGPSL